MEGTFQRSGRALDSCGVSSSSHGVASFPLRGLRVFLMSATQRLHPCSDPPSAHHEGMQGFNILNTSANRTISYTKTIDRNTQRDS